MNVKGKYLKDENGDVISPITSTDTIFKENTKLLDLIFPVGSYYETSDIDFNPNTSWGGIWTQDTIGYVTVGADTVGDSELEKHNLPSLNVGITYGEMEHTLTVDEMPSHRHLMTSWQYYNNGTAATGRKVAKTIDEADYNGSSTEPIAPTGGGQSHNNMQPSIGVIRWHRTA